MDSENKKLALVNSGVPEFNSKEELTGHRNMTVVFSFADVALVSVIQDGAVAMVHFHFVRPIPPWNVRKELTYSSGEGIRKFFERYVSELKVGYYRKNQYGGVDPQ